MPSDLLSIIESSGACAYCGNSGPTGPTIDHQLQVEGTLAYILALPAECYCPQSVAHMPFKAMIYKTLSTVVDDLFACVGPPPVAVQTAEILRQLLYQNAVAA